MRKRNERITMLAVGGTLALNYPWLSLFSADQFLLGIPSLYLYLFLVWGVFIALVGWFIDTADANKNNLTPSVTKERDSKISDA